MVSHRDVFKTEFGEFLTYPDGDPATKEEIEHYLCSLSPSFRKLIESDSYEYLIIDDPIKGKVRIKHAPLEPGKD